MWKFFLLSLITLGIYGVVVLYHVSNEINQVASPRDGKKTMNYLWVFFLFSWLTLGIIPLIWYHKLSNRMGDELQARGINYEISAGTFWGWYVLGSLIFVGPFVYYSKFFKAMNLINADYNAKSNGPAADN